MEIEITDSWKNNTGSLTSARSTDTRVFIYVHEQNFLTVHIFLFYSEQ